MRIQVILEALTGSFDTDMDRSSKAAERRFKEMERELNSSVQRIGAIVSVGATAFAALSKHAIDDADAQKDLAQQVGLTVEKLSELSYAAIQDGASQEDLGKAIFKLNEVMVEAVDKGGAAADTLKKFGISTQDLISGAVGTDEALKRIADKFNAMPDGAQKSALAAELLGTKLGQKMIPFLNEGAAGLKRLADEAHASGAVLDDLTANQLAKVNDQLDAFGRNLLTHVEVGLAAVLETLGLIEGKAFEKDIAEINDQIQGLTAQLALLDDAKSRGAATSEGWLGKIIHGDDEDKIKRLTQDLHDLEAARDRLIAKQSGGSKTGVTGGIAPPDQQAAIRKQIEDFNKDLLKAAEQYDKTLQDVIDKYDVQGAKARQLTQDQILLQQAAAAGNQQAIDALNQMAVDVNNLGEEVKDTASGMTEFWKEAAHNMQDAFANFLFDPFKDGLSGMLEGFAETLRRMAAEAAAAQLFKYLLGDTFGKEGGSLGGLIGGLFGGGKAGGGDVFDDRTYLVGENGPEMFIPRTAGKIVPIAANGWGGGGTVVNMTVNTPDADSFRASQRQIVRDTRRKIGL